MKVKFHSTLLFLFLYTSFFLKAQDACTPIGWASQNGGTTGGGSVSAVTVSTLSALQTQASSSGAKVIYVSGTLGAGVGTRVSVSSNKTIFGLPGATLQGGFDVKNASNVIIRNMIIIGPGAIDVDGVDCMTIDNSTNVWVDHCDIRDGQDGNLDIVNGSNYVSVTWTKFSYSNASVEHQFCNLIGNSDSKTSDRGKLKVTMMFNYWTKGCVERMPRVRFGQVHVVNNLFDSQEGAYCVRAGIEADIYVEANAFIGVKKPIDLYLNDFTAVTAVNNLFSGTTGNTSGSGTAFNPYASYALATKIPASAVESTVKPCVGATLTVPTACPCGVALPVSILQFSGEENETQITLRWQLENFRDVESATLEFSGGGEFQPLAEVNSPSNSMVFFKSSFSSSTVLFRLSFVEKNGDRSYSEILPFEFSHIQIFPNPSQGKLQWSGNANIERVEVYSSTGILVENWNLSSNAEEIELSSLSAGTYRIVFFVHGGSIVQQWWTKL